METQPCDDDRKNTLSCPVFENQGRCFTDKHHTEYPRNLYKTSLEKHHRELDPNKVQICRALHDAIHASGYQPAKPSNAAMALEMWDDDTTRADAERERQIKLGYIVLDGMPDKEIA